MTTRWMEKPPLSDDWRGIEAKRVETERARTERLRAARLGVPVPTETTGALSAPDGATGAGVPNSPVPVAAPATTAAPEVPWRAAVKWNTRRRRRGRVSDGVPTIKARARRVRAPKERVSKVNPYWPSGTWDAASRAK